MDAVTIGISFCSTPNKYNYLALRYLLCPCVLPHQFEFWHEDGAVSVRDMGSSV